jgi:hypothetical protein
VCVAFVLLLHQGMNAELRFPCRARRGERGSIKDEGETTTRRFPFIP